MTDDTWRMVALPTKLIKLVHAASEKKSINPALYFRQSIACALRADGFEVDPQTDPDDWEG